MPTYSSAAVGSQRIDPAGTLVEDPITGAEAKVLASPASDSDAALVVREVGGSASSTANSTMLAQAGGAVFLGSAWIDSLEWPNIDVAIFADQPSATDGLEIQYSADTVTVHDQDRYTIPGGNGQTIKVGSGWRYVRVKYTNGGAPSTVLVLQTLLRRYAQKSSTHRVKDAIGGEQDTDLITAVVKGAGAYGGQAGVSGSVNVPAGYWVRSYAAQSGTSAASIAVPGVSGTITVPGSNQASTQFSDNPDPGTLIGPCTFTFSNTAAYAVIWQVF